MDTHGISHNIMRYMDLRKHHDDVFCENVKALEQWKMSQMTSCYKNLMTEPSYKYLLEYYFNEIFFGIDLSELREAKSATKFIEKFFTSTDMLMAALEYNALTGEINQKITAHITDNNELFDINLFEAFADNLNETVSNRVIQASIKMARFPAKLSGCERLHKLISDGFAILKKVDNPEKVVGDLIKHERLILQRIASGTQPIYIPT